MQMVAADSRRHVCLHHFLLLECVHHHRRCRDGHDVDVHHHRGHYQQMEYHLRYPDYHGHGHRCPRHHHQTFWTGFEVENFYAYSWTGQTCSHHQTC